MIVAMYHLWTKSKIKEILTALSCAYRSSWSKDKLVSVLCEQPVESVLGMLTSTEVKDMLHKLQVQISGDEEESRERLLHLLIDARTNSSDLAEPTVFCAIDEHIHANAPVWSAPKEQPSANNPSDLPDLYGLHLVEVPAGSFFMGAIAGDHYANENEKPQHKVTLTKAMMVSRYPCTQKLYDLVMWENPSEKVDPMCPVENVSWLDAVFFCNTLSIMDDLEPAYVLPESMYDENEILRDVIGSEANDISRKVIWNADANGYRLLTEAEWEYCARGGESHLYAGSNECEDVACTANGIDDASHSVGSKQANGFGLYDMSGNVFEWVWDSDCRKYGSETIDPVYVDHTSPDRVFRGGSWGLGSCFSRASVRFGNRAALRTDVLGFRFMRPKK